MSSSTPPWPQPPQEEIPRRLAPGIWVLGNLYFNLYLVRGDRRTALVETGVSAVVDAVLDQLDQLDAAPDYLVLTHPHTDHCTGLNGLLDRYPQAQLVAAEGADDFVSHPKAGAKMAAEDAHMSARLAEIGWSPGRPPVERVALPREGLRLAATTEIDLGGLTLRCLPVQGHSPGSLAVQVPESQVLMTSDALGFRYLDGSFCPLFFTGYRAYLAEMDRLAALAPVVLGPAHQGPLTGVHARAAFAAARQATLGLYERIVGHQGPPEELSDRLFEHYYRETFTLYTAANIRGCMQLLVRRALEAHHAQEH